MRVLIIGGGLVGGHVAHDLVERGDEVAIVDVEPNEPYLRRVAGSDVTIHQVEIVNLPAVTDAVRAVQPEVVVHTAALIGGAAQRAPYWGVQVNVIGSIHVAEAVRSLGVSRLVHSSTLGVNDLSQPQSGPITETFPVGGSGRIYGASKVAAEVLLDAYANEYGFELAMLRFAGIYGYGHFRGGSGIGREMHGLVMAGLRGRPVTLGAGVPARSEMVHAKDVAQGVAAAVHADALPHRVYNIGTGVLVEPVEVVEVARRIFPELEVTLGGSRPDLHPRLEPFDLTQSRAELGYVPRFDLEGGLRDLTDELRSEA